LGHKREEFVESLSRGMKQRLCLARTLAHDPQILILDEPASGLDPRARIEIRELLKELRNMGKTIFFSSHILSEVADICSSIGIIEAGRLIAYGDMEEMKRKLRAHRLISVKVLGEVTAVQEFLLHTEDVQSIIAGSEAGLAANEVRFDFVGDDVALSQVLAGMIGRGIAVTSFNEEVGDLEDVFLQVTQGIVN
jgi:ABC-2 type transport system ATP-binding protein